MKHGNVIFGNVRQGINKETKMTIKFNWSEDDMKRLVWDIGMLSTGLGNIQKTINWKIPRNIKESKVVYLLKESIEILLD